MIDLSSFKNKFSTCKELKQQRDNFAKSLEYITNKL